MKIILDDIGRRFNREWIFRNLSYSFHEGHSYAILGANGAGKSTLLQLLAGSLSPSEGSIQFEKFSTRVVSERVFRQVSLAAPYLELLEELTLVEHIDFHFRFKKYRKGQHNQAIIDLLDLFTSRNKAIKHFSSGMKQRLKLALAFCSDTPVLLLDEPTSNLDSQGINWYLSLIEKYTQNRIVLISSNQKHEYDFCSHILNIEDYKSSRRES